MALHTYVRTDMFWESRAERGFPKKMVLPERVALYRETGKGLSAYTVKKMLPALKQEHKWLKEPHSQYLQSAVLNLSQVFVNFFEGRAKYPKFKSKYGRQSIQ